MSERAGEGVGIDLGTTFSSLSYLDSQMTPRVVCDSSGQAVMPSVVFFDDQEVIVGEMALSQARLRAHRVVQFIKVHMGDEWRREFNGQVHTPESISALILGQLIREAEPQIGDIRRAVITAPAYFTEKRRRATQQAGEIAGLDVLGTLNEPMSAALAYGLHRTGREQFAVIYDLGGGTFDVTVVRITPNELEELATNGNRQLGGRDWDQTLIDYVADDFQKKFGQDLREDIQAMQDLQIECEHAKRQLSRLTKSAIRVHARGHDHAVEVTRDRFESLTAHLLQATKLTTEIALEDARLDWKNVSRVVLVGGSTHMPAVRKMLKEVSGMAPDSGVNPVVAVSLGAAIYAHMLETGREIKAIVQKPQESEVEILEEVDEPPVVAAPDESLVPLEDLVAEAPLSAVLTPETVPIVHFVTAHGVGVKVKKEDVWRNVVLIPRNTRVPQTVTRRFRTTGRAVDRVQLAVKITQGDAVDVDLVEELGTGVIGLPPGEVPGRPVDVTLEFDKQGRLRAHALYVQTGQQMSMTVQVKGGLREQDVATYRKFMEATGFHRPFDSRRALDKLQDADDEDEDVPLLEPI